MNIEQQIRALGRSMKEYAENTARRLRRIENRGKAHAGMQALAAAEGRLSSAERAELAAQRVQARLRVSEREARRSGAPRGFLGIIDGMSDPELAELSAQFAEHGRPMGFALCRDERERMTYGGRSFAEVEALVADLQATATRSRSRR